MAAARRSLTDADCVALLRWGLPALGLQLEGTRRVRRRLCRRLARRMAVLGLPDASACRHLLETSRAEREVFDACCRLPISRFYRDRGVFDGLRRSVLPARTGLFSPGTAKDLPPGWREAIFDRSDGLLRLRERFRAGVEFRLQDLRRQAPDGGFDLVLCRNAAFAYFAPPVQRAVLARIAARTRSGGAPVVGRHEVLPDDGSRWVAFDDAPSVFRRVAAAARGCAEASP